MFRGWSETENGSLEIGRPLTQRAFERRRESAHALHALAHAMFEDGSTADAEDLIAGWLPIYHRSGLLHGHVAWHQALLALENGDSEKAGAIYAERLQPKLNPAPPLNVMTDGASLLWRPQAFGPSGPGGVLVRLAHHPPAAVSKSGKFVLGREIGPLGAVDRNRRARGQA